MPELSSQDIHTTTSRKKVNITFPYGLLFSFILIITLVEYRILSVNVLSFTASTNLVYYSLSVTFYNNVHTKY